MLLLIPCIYVYSFFKAFYSILHRKPQDIFLFFVIGLPIYITSLSLTYKYGFEELVPFLQSFKELLVLAALGVLLYRRKEKMILTWPDKLVFGYLAYTALYVFLPIGSFSFMEKLLALKSLSFFPLVYFTGRLIQPAKINLDKYFHYICIVTVLAGGILAMEVLRDENLQISTGYAEFNEVFFGMEPSGHFNLSWTFETSNGLKRFASFFSMPLELGVNTLLTLAIILSLSTMDDNRIKISRFLLLTLIVSCFSILFAISRASMVSYFALIFVYALVTHRKKWLKIFYYTCLTFLVLVMFILQGDIYDLIINTINFTDNSSAFHILQWLEGLQAIIASPLGLGLGMSGRVSIAFGENIGGENQLIIIGVQAGVVAIAMYIAIYISAIRLSLHQFHIGKGKTRKLALTLLLVKIGLIIPTFTANVESYLYVSYITWFCFGLLVTMSTLNKHKIQDTAHVEKK